MEVLYGIHPVLEAVRSGSRIFDHVCVARDRRDAKLQHLADLCKSSGIPLRFESREQLTLQARSSAHQGVLAVVRERAFARVEDLLSDPAANPLLLALDGVEDPQNFGALLRVADGAGVNGVLVTERRSAPLSAVAIKASAGAAEHVTIAKAVNLVRALETVKEAGVWCLGLDERGTTDYDAYDYRGPCCLVLGREGDGLHDLVRKTCDQLLRIPMGGSIASLNVATAGAVVLFEASRQRRAALLPPQLLADKHAARPRKGLGS